MGFLDKLKDTAKVAKDKAVDVVDDHGPQIKQGIHKAGDFVDQKTKGKYSDKIAKGTQQAGVAVDKIAATDKPAHRDKPAKPVKPAEPTPPPSARHTPPPAAPPAP